ncbi:MAG: hypothetical protein GY904_27115, partial [Planctomycetaceae bacterium]|nr:hypothetical protein [Planctomycetaceae bacterium]
MIKNKLGTLSLAIVPLVIGLLVGLAVPVDFIRSRVATSLKGSQADAKHDHGGDDTHAGETDHVELSPTAQASMGLKTGVIKFSDYQSNFELPAFVREIPGA